MSEDVRGLELLRQLKNDRDFCLSIELVRHSGGVYAQAASASLILEKYHLPSTFWEIISYYIETDVWDESLIGEYVSIEANPKGTVSLVLAHDITVNELKAYIDKYWRSSIKPGLDAYALDRRKRIITKPLSDRDRDIRADIDAGLSNIVIASNHEVDVKTVGRIKSAYKKDKKRVF
ncbi:MAG: hypothetical protein JWN28_268 [Candidatus Saccharibacteria bacterium]|nr:hypothetical protein [Candidatus Saccharibacteria bacterium]